MLPSAAATPALRRDGVAARRKHLGDAGGLEPGGGAAQGRAQPGAAGADDDDVIGVVGDRIGGGHSPTPSSTLNGRQLIGGSERQGQHGDDAGDGKSDAGQAGDR